MAKLIVVCVLCASAVAADVRWERTDYPHDTWRLAEGKVQAIVHDDAPYDEAVRICVLGPKDTARRGRRHARRRTGATGTSWCRPAATTWSGRRAARSSRGAWSPYTPRPKRCRTRAARRAAW